MGLDQIKNPNTQHLTPTMKKQRLQAYLNLIEKLLTCPRDEVTLIINQSLDLVDEEFVQKCEQVAEQLQKAGQENQSDFLQNLAQQLLTYLNGEKNYRSFLQEVLEATQKSQCDPSVVYPLLQQNLDKLDLRLAQIL